MKTACVVLATLGLAPHLYAWYDFLYIAFYIITFFFVHTRKQNCDCDPWASASFVFVTFLIRMRDMISFIFLLYFLCISSNVFFLKFTPQTRKIVIVTHMLALRRFFLVFFLGIHTGKQHNCDRYVYASSAAVLIFYFLLNSHNKTAQL